MAQTTTATKADLEELLDQVQNCLEDAYTPESSREDLAEAIGKALNLLEDEDSDSDDDSDNNESEDDDDSSD
jgi:predicted RNase H-like HicB family nuclease